ncbi:MAG: hypothetical protein ACI9AV_000503, partial [Sediminicola sp.]
ALKRHGQKAITLTHLFCEWTSYTKATGALKYFPFERIKY